MMLLVNIDYAGDIQSLRDRLEARFRTRVNIALAECDFRAFLDARRNQYDSSAIINWLELAFSPFSKPVTAGFKLAGGQVGFLSGEADRVLAVTGVDLYIPVLTFVFGQARLNGRCAVVSSFRLDNKFYGLPDNPALLQERLLKEAIHELGHTFGLLHCHDPECVMKSSTYVEEIDFKSSRFCERCFDKLVEY